MEAAVCHAVWAAGVVVIMVTGRWIMGAYSPPSWRGFTSLWSFASAPWAVVALISAGLSVSDYGADLGRAGGLAALAILLAGILWGIAVQVHAVRHAFDSDSTIRATMLAVAVWTRQSALGYVL